MTVAELIKKLEDYSQDTVVVAAGYEGGYIEESFRLYTIPLKANVNTEWYYGEHEPSRDEETADFTALAIGR